MPEKKKITEFQHKNINFHIIGSNVHVYKKGTGQDEGYNIGLFTIPLDKLLNGLNDSRDRTHDGGIYIEVRPEDAVWFLNKDGEKSYGIGADECVKMLREHEVYREHHGKIRVEKHYTCGACCDLKKQEGGCPVPIRPKVKDGRTQAKLTEVVDIGD